MGAGRSAEHEARVQRALAHEHEHLAQLARESASRYAAAATTEQRLGHALSVLGALGYLVLADRRWPGSRAAQVDFVVVGPSGIHLIDAKSWREVSVHGDRVFQGQDDVTERFAHFAELADRTEAVLANDGVAPMEVRATAVFMGTSGLSGRAFTVDLVSEADAVGHLLRRGRRFTAAQVDRLVPRLIELFPAYEVDPRPVTVTVPAPILPELPVAEPQPALMDVGALHELMIEHELSKPIEQWMSFLHPDQARLVRRNFTGPSRIRGAAGTGKTVVGLHRAAYLARTRPGTVLVTTFIRTLPAVLESLLARLAPEVGDRVEFAGVFEFAKKVLVDRGVRYRLDGRGADAAFAEAWREIGLRGRLGAIDRDPDYWKQEVLTVIKGRGLTSFEQYAELARVGRRRRLTVEQRRAVWELHRDYDRRLRAQGIHDFADVIALAEHSLRETPLEGYSAVVVDEAQDLSCMMVRMLHALVGDRPDGLNLIGDGQQTIYPGGYTLGEANVSIAGRGVVMTRNYRNTVEIVDFARSLVAGDEFTDIEGGRGVADETEIVRHGAKPRVARFQSTAGHDRSLVQHVLALRDGGADFGDIGVLALTTWAVRDTVRMLGAAGIPTVELTRYDGTTRSAVKVGTIKRAKGLEFAHVLVARTPPELLDRAPLDPESAQHERRELTRRELYVAMTRARDGLWVGVA